MKSSLMPTMSTCPGTKRLERREGKGGREENVFFFLYCVYLGGVIVLVLLIMNLTIEIYCWDFIFHSCCLSYFLLCLCELFSFGFVTFDDVASAKKAMEQHDGVEIDGFVIGLRFAEERPRDGGRGGGRGGGGFRGRG